MLFRSFGGRRKRRRRRLKPQVYYVCGVILLLSYRFMLMETMVETTELTYESPQVILKDAGGRLVSRNSSLLARFLPDDLDLSMTINSSTTMEQARQGREPILSILREAGITGMTTKDVLALPRWRDVEELYGEQSMILGLETCQEFRKRVPSEKRFLAISGIFNSGTTAFGISLQANCGFENHPKNFSNDLVTDVNGMLNQVPWAKHKMADFKHNNTIIEGVDKDYVLPVVLVRDPYYWMQSMCKQGYGVRWDHNSNKHCPNLVPNDYDRSHYKRLATAQSVGVWMGAGPKAGPRWESLVHYWNDWYFSYVKADFPRLIVRFEDTLYRGKEVMRQVCECAGARMNPHYKYLVDEAKWNHQHSQNNMLSAMLKYGTDNQRYRNMTEEDKLYAKDHLSEKLLRLFNYKTMSTTTSRSLMNSQHEIPTVTKHNPIMSLPADYKERAKKNSMSNPTDILAAMNQPGTVILDVRTKEEIEQARVVVSNEQILGQRWVHPPRLPVFGE